MALYSVISQHFQQTILLSGFTLKKCKMVSMFTWPDVSTWEVGGISVGNHDAKRSVFQLIECSPNLPNVYIRLCKHGNHFTFLL